MNVKFSLKQYKFQDLITLCYLMLMFSIFLFYMQDGYFNLTASRLSFFTNASAALILIMAFWKFVHIRKVSFPWSIHFSMTDWAMLCLLASHCITTMLSVSPIASITGNQGRGTGLVFTFLITGMYFIVSRSYCPYKMIFPFLIGCTDLIILLGLLNFFGCDPLDLFSLITAEELPHYLSTMGNITFYAHLMILVLPIGIFFYLQSRKRIAKVFFGFSVILEFMGVYISNLDGAYLGLSAIFLCLFARCMTYEKAKQAMIIATFALASAKVLSLVSTFITTGREFSTLSHFIVHTPFTTIVLMLFLFLSWMMCWQKDWFHSLAYCYIRKWVLGIMGGCILFIMGCFCYFSLFDRSTSLGALEDILRFSDQWGHGRGFIWKALIQIVLEQFHFLQYMFGYGLDCVRTMMVNYIDVPDILYYDNAHNEYLQYFITSGIIGLLTYVWLIISLLVRMLHKKAPPIAWAIACSLIAHCAWAVTGLNQPITTPIVFILIALGEGLLRNQKKSINF